MAKIIKSATSGWLASSDVFYNKLRPSMLAESLAEAVTNIKNAQQCLDNADGLQPFSFSVTTADTEELIENLRKFVYFCNGIHYEISEFVDTPFSTQMGALAMDTIELDPSDYKYVKSQFLCFKNYMTLSDLVLSAMEDEALKTSFDELAKEMDEDTASTELQDSIKEANWWQEQFRIAEDIDAATDAFFTPEVKEKWNDMTPEDRDKYIQAYKDILDRIYFGGENRVPRSVNYLNITKDENGNDVYPGFGAASKAPQNKIAINWNFRDNPTGMYSLDKMVDTMTHEMRHRYQDMNTSDMPKSVRDRWDEEYIEYDKKKNNYTDYYRQPVEEDAKAFAALAHDDED